MSNTEFKLWDYVTPKYRADNLSDDPFHLNFKNPAVMDVKLHPKIWLIKGLVVQIIHYSEYNPLAEGEKFSTPVVLERWRWTLDPSTSFAIARDITVQGLNSDGELIGEEHSMTKFYTSPKEKLTELARRRDNVVCDMKDDIITALAITETHMDVAAAIYMGQQYITTVHSLIEKYITDGITTVVEKTTETGAGSLREQFKWLNNDMTLMGRPGVPMWKVMYDTIMQPTYETITNFDYSQLPTK